MATGLQLKYPALLDVIAPCLVPGRTESHSFLVWFLQHFFVSMRLNHKTPYVMAPMTKGSMEFM